MINSLLITKSKFLFTDITKIHHIRKERYIKLKSYGKIKINIFFKKMLSKQDNASLGPSETWNLVNYFLSCSIIIFGPA